MATLELSIDESPAVGSVQRTRRLGALFWAAIGWMIFIFAAAALAGVLPMPSPTDMDMLERRAPACAAHWLGTDGLGRDEFARLIHGARISLTVGLCAPIIGLAIGGALGMLAGYFRGRFEAVRGRQHGRAAGLSAADAGAGGHRLSRPVRAQPHLRPRRARHSRLHARGACGHADAVASASSSIAARALGASHARILLRELLPNVLLPLLAFFLLGVAVTIVVEGALSFLGLGVPPPAPSWGSMIGEGRESLEIAPRLAFIPAARCS